MSDRNDQRQEGVGRTIGGPLTSFFVGLARDAFKLAFAFAIGTGGGAIVCLYYDVPLAFSILGGILALGVVIVLMSALGFD